MAFVEAYMALSVSYSGGSGLFHLLKQTRPLNKDDAEPGTPANDVAATTPSAASPSRIDSTGAGTAHIAAALTLFMTQLGGPEGDLAGGSGGKTTKPTQADLMDPSLSDAVVSEASDMPANSRSAASLLRTLDAYASYASTSTNRVRLRA